MNIELVTVDGYRFRSGMEEYYVELEDDGSEVFITVDVRSPFHDVAFCLLTGGDDDRRLPMCCGRFFSRTFRCRGFNRAVFVTVREAEFACRMTSKVGRRVEALDPVPVELIPPQRDNESVSRMIALAVRGEIDRRFPDRAGNFEDEDNNLDFDADYDEAGSGYMEPDLPSDYQERGRVRRKDKPPKGKGDVRRKGEEPDEGDSDTSDSSDGDAGGDST